MKQIAQRPASKSMAHHGAELAAFLKSILRGKLSMNLNADSLLRECREAARRGADFAAIWESILSRHSLVAGSPVLTFDEQPHLDVRLQNGHCLRYCTRSNDFSLSVAVRSRPF